MERNKAARLADFVAVFKPQWNMREVTDEIARLAGASDAVIAHYVIDLVQDSETRLPSRIGLRWDSENPELKNNNRRRPGRTEPCDICGRTEWQCNQVIRNRCGDGHTYTPAAPRGYRNIDDADILGAIDALGGIGRPV